ncbi:FxDxF family PEP-CTERM protein [Massilia sp. PAMC28688]|uniref:FxDxF family PEP-CTERM protein n=1 Tax=Massilia sp. PAMC28688 TaxID=2861283 RepID=UPI001C62AED0|nr:FxDxF family PEP-CTERM protein [Massilia sp. PAMC28688]QYF92381.1 FxDxF family PEP-CTERM protein [Massilia sp. PAMC28688]
MNKSRAFLSAIALASATLMSQSAFAGPIASTTTDITLVDNKASFEQVLTGGNAGATFHNRYQFTLGEMGDFNADLSLGNGANKSLSITGFTLLDSKGNTVGSSTAAGTGWLLDVDNLASGSYTVQVSGALSTNAAGKYYGNLMLGPSAIAAVPEPAPVGLMLAGLGVLGFSVRRRARSA